MEIKDLDRQIKDKTLGTLYFFWGEEQFLMENKIKSIKRALLEPDFEDLNFSCLDDKKPSLSRLNEELMSVPVMSEKRMVVVKNSGIFNNAKLADYKKVCEMLEDLPEYLCVIFCEAGFDKKKEKNLDPIRKNCGIVKFDFLSPVQLERWLDKMFADKGKSILPRDIGSIIKRCGTSMAPLFNEANKLISFVGEREKITADDVEAVVSKSIDTRIFDVIDNIAAGRSQGVFDELAALKASGENPSTIFSLLSGRVGELLMVKQLCFDKLSAEKIATYFEPKRPVFVVDKLIQSSKNFSEEFLVNMTLCAPEYTALVRSGRLDKWAAVEMYASKLLYKL